MNTDKVLNGAGHKVNAGLTNGGEGDGTHQASFLISKLLSLLHSLPHIVLPTPAATHNVLVFARARLDAGSACHRQGK